MKLAFATKTLAAAVIAMSAHAGAAQAQTKIRAGTASFNEALMPIYAAQEKGYYKEAGIEVEMTNFRGGAPAIQALVSGGIEMCLCAADHIVRLKGRRMPAQILVGLDEFHSYAIVAKASTPFTNLESLKGKRIGITAPGSLTDNTLRYSMVSSGFRPERDFEIMGTGGGGPMIAAIDTGQVDAGMLITTDIENIMQKPGAYKVVIEYRDMPYASFGALVLQSWVKANPKDAAAFAKATVRAIEDLKKDPKFAVSVIQKMYPSFSPELAAAVAKSAVQRTPNGGIVSAASLENLNKIVTATDKSLTPVSLDEAFDASLVKQ
jgi:NitT/TauT family transport system substrate-binding protein